MHKDIINAKEEWFAPVEVKIGPDAHSASSRRQVREIMAYWAKRGLYPKIWVTKIPTKSGRDIIQCIRSNMVSGWPRPTIKSKVEHY